MPMLSQENIKEIMDAMRAMRAAQAHRGAVGGAVGVSWSDQTQFAGGGGSAFIALPWWPPPQEPIGYEPYRPLPPQETARPDSRDILIAALIKAGNKLNPNFSPGVHQEKLIWIEWQAAVKAAAEALFDGIVPEDEP